MKTMDMNKIRIKSDLTPINTYVYDENEKLIPVQKMIITIEDGEVTKVDLKIPLLPGNGSRIDGIGGCSRKFTFKKRHSYILKSSKLLISTAMIGYYAKNGRLYKYD